MTSRLVWQVAEVHGAGEAVAGDEGVAEGPVGGVQEVDGVQGTWLTGTEAEAWGIVVGVQEVGEIPGGSQLDVVGGWP